MSWRHQSIVDCLNWKNGIDVTSGCFEQRKSINNDYNHHAFLLRKTCLSRTQIDNTVLRFRCRFCVVFVRLASSFASEIPGVGIEKEANP